MGLSSYFCSVENICNITVAGRGGAHLKSYHCGGEASLVFIVSFRSVESHSKTLLKGKGRAHVWVSGNAPFTLPISVVSYLCFWWLICWLGQTRVTLDCQISCLCWSSQRHSQERGEKSFVFLNREKGSYIPLLTLTSMISRVLGCSVVDSSCFSTGTSLDCSRWLFSFA